MLQTETYMPAPQLSLFPLPEFDSAKCPDHLSPLPQEMLEIFEQLTGWVIGFHESKSSYQRRQLPSMVPQAADGDFEIVDMSAHWPACKPTAHRGKCDQFVGYLNALVTELQQTRSELAATQSILESCSPGSVDDEEALLCDSFIPRYQEEDRPEEDFELTQTIGPDKNAQAVDPPFEGWRLEGGPGIVDGRYIDWRLSADECIDLIIGRVETPDDLTETEAVLKIDPLTNEYFLSGDVEMEFLIYDERNRYLTRVEPANRFRQLKSSQMIILSTSCQLSELVSRPDINPLPGSFEQLSRWIADQLGNNEHFLILKRRLGVRPGNLPIEASYNSQLADNHV